MNIEQDNREKKSLFLFSMLDEFRLYFNRPNTVLVSVPISEV